MAKITLGGERLGSGNRMKVNLHGYGKSNHDLSRIWRSSMATGTLVPFLSLVGLSGDSFEINLDAAVNTLPATGPLFGSSQLELHVFTCPIRLYQAQLHNNKLGIGLKMETIKLPQVEMEAKNPIPGEILPQGKTIDTSQINPSSIWHYLGISGLGKNLNEAQETVKRQFNAIPYLGYWDIYKNYYANKQEEIGAVIHHRMRRIEIDTMILSNDGGAEEVEEGQGSTSAGTISPSNNANIEITWDQAPIQEDIDGVYLYSTTGGVNRYLIDIFDTITTTGVTTTFSNVTSVNSIEVYGYDQNTTSDMTTPTIRTFPLENLDDMREDILDRIKDTSPFIIDKDTYEPYGLSLKKSTDGLLYSKQGTQEGLAIKAYKSDLFNNWLNTEWIDGDGGINDITAINVVDDKIQINEFLLKKKAYDMLNRIAVSGGTYDDYLEVNYNFERFRNVETPMYEGGLMQDIVFQEVVSNAETEENPLGTLAGRGVLAGRGKGGRINIRVAEPSYIIGIVSITPRMDYSQGNKWDNNLKNMSELHVPALDEIGFQDLITDQMSWLETELDASGVATFKSAGKQPAWVNYMTAINETHGNFAVPEEGTGSEMFMTLNRQYEYDNELNIKDLTTYIDPVKSNQIFADSRLDAQNFWVQINCRIKARRIMSAKLMPNL